MSNRAYQKFVNTKFVPKINETRNMDKLNFVLMLNVGTVSEFNTINL